MTGTRIFNVDVLAGRASTSRVTDVNLPVPAAFVGWAIFFVKIERVAWELHVRVVTYAVVSIHPLTIMLDLYGGLTDSPVGVVVSATFDG
jgi:hypothetical protein